MYNTNTNPPPFFFFFFFLGLLAPYQVDTRDTASNSPRDLDLLPYCDHSEIAKMGVVWARWVRRTGLPWTGAAGWAKTGVLELLEMWLLAVCTL